ncbi:MAG TPA: trehalose-phosphatase [Burkholderiales bacterium]|nr:trehalose-phosphatase [Burkholderiales bacterium]
MASSEQSGLPRFDRNWALFLDVDGTLLDVADRPEAVVVPPNLCEILQRISQLTGGALALVSGRQVADLDRLFEPVRYPAAGQHGVERRDALGKTTMMGGVAHLIHAAASELREQASGQQGVCVEHKGLTLAMHYRLAPHRRDWVAGAMRSLLARLGDEFRLIEGDMVFEIAPGGKDKGVAISEFMREPPFAGRLPVFLGDDSTDEDGFDVVNALNGLSVKVGAGVSVARWRAADAQSVRKWLADYAQYLTDDRCRGKGVDLSN